MRDFPLRAWVYALTVVVAAVAATVFLGMGARRVNFQIAFAFGLIFLLAELVPFNLPNASYSISFVVAVAALVVAGPAEAAIAASFGALDLSMRKRPDWLGRMVFNGAQLSFSMALSGATYHAAGGPVGRVGPRDLPRAFLPVLIASAVYFVANTGLVSQMISLVRRVPLREVWHSNYAPIAAGTFAFAVLGIVLGALYLQMGIGVLLFALMPLLVARRALQGAAKMDAAYEDTLHALVAAIEAKDAYTRGHAERVSRLATMIARELKLSERRIRSLRIAALMHDVGKLVVSTTILQKPGKLTDEEYEHMKWHPIHGCEVISEIDFLRDGEAVNAVRHHHERLDGRGYPDNLFGDEVPLTARIVMVADAFDSMTSTRTYRMAKGVEDGMRELRRCATTQFDPLCIAALDRAIGRHGWEPTPELFEGEKTERPAVNVHAARG